MDISHLEAFAFVARERSFLRASQRLNRTQSAISQAVRRLEEDIGETLLDRATRDGTLTDAGRALLDYANRILNLRAEAHAVLRELRLLHEGQVSIGSNEYAVTYLLRILERFNQLYPKIKIDIRRTQASSLPTNIINHSVELGILTFQPRNPDLQSFLITRDSGALVVSCKHPLARKKSVSIHDLAVEKCVVHDINSPYRLKVENTFQSYKVAYDVVVQLPSIEAIKRFVATSNLFCILPRQCVEAEVAHGMLAAIPIRELKTMRSLYLIFRRKVKLSYAANAFLQVAKTCAEETLGN